MNLMDPENKYIYCKSMTTRGSWLYSFEGLLHNDNIMAGKIGCLL